MSQKIGIVSLLILLSLAAILFAQPVSASNQPQGVYQTPTALPDGRIVYVVQPNDTCIRIEILTGVKVEQLRTQNKLDQDCTLSVGKELVLGFVTPVVSPTPNPAVTATPLLISPTPFKGNGQICVVLFNDVNGNAFQETGEGFLDGGAISISDPTGSISRIGTTKISAEDPYCADVPEGTYNISVAIPDGYNPTVISNLKDLPVQAGETTKLNFGAQVSEKAAESNPAVTQPEQGNNNLMLGVLGGLILLIGIGLGVYVVVMRR